MGRDGSGWGEPHLHIELLSVTLCVLHQQLQRVLVTTLRLLAGHLGTDVLLNLGMDDVACPQALCKQGESELGLVPPQQLTPCCQLTPHRHPSLLPWEHP